MGEVGWEYAAVCRDDGSLFFDEEKLGYNALPNSVRIIS